MIRSNVEKLLAFVTHNNQWLLDRYHTALETQIYVKPGTEEEAHPTRNDCWTNGIHTWKQVRWPYNAGTKPNFKDWKPDFPLDPAEGYTHSLGTTWWNWERLESEAVVFDFDSIVGHKAGLATKELNRIIAKLKKLDYVTIIKSTSGNGFHVLVFFEEGKRPKTANHNEHALVAEVVLQKMSEDAGFDLADKVDCYGMIGWIWSVRANAENQGFAMVKQAERDLPADQVPDWTNLPAKRMKSRPKVVAFDENGQEIVGNNIIGFSDEVIVLDKMHMKILKALESSGYNFNHVAEHDLYHTHTMALKKVHKDLDIKGPFETATSESNLCNCYIRPMNGGGFAVFRFGKGTLEHQLWDQTGTTTWCTFNQIIPAHKILLRMGAEWVAESKIYEFQSHQELVKATDALGNKVPLLLLDNRHYGLHINGRGCVIKCFCTTEESPGNCDNWTRVKGYYKKPLSRLEEVDTDSILGHVDNTVRYVTRQGETLGWAVKTEAGWIRCKSEDAKRVAEFNVGAQGAKMYLGVANTNPWTLVNKPFERENLQGRQWNLDSAQLVTPCATQPGPHPHWDILLNHLGQSWDEPLSEDVEMQKYGIFTGADYLRAWIACLIRHPQDPLPYIFLVGPQNTGKSLIHEVLRECIQSGVVHGGNALVSGSGFNGEFEGKVLAAIDETDLSQSPGLAARLKSWTNATYIQIHRKGCQPYDVPNYIHFLQSANTVQALIIEHGDTRIVIGEVPRFEGAEIPKPIFIKRCLDELPNFLYTLGTMQLPPMAGRTRLPVITTAIKQEILNSTEPDSLAFLKTMYHEVPGQSVKLVDAYNAYKTWCVAESKKPVAPNDFKLQIGLKYPVHKGPTGRAFAIGNLSLDKNALPKEAFLMEGKNGRHQRCTTN